MIGFITKELILLTLGNTHYSLIRVFFFFFNKAEDISNGK